MGSLTECFQKIAEGYTARRGALFSDSDILSGDSTSPGLISTSSGNLLTRTSAHRERGGSERCRKKRKVKLYTVVYYCNMTAFASVCMVV